MAEIYFTKEHEWVKVNGTSAVCGISDHAAHELGDITFVELPAVGKQVKQFDVLAAIESVKAASDIYAPAEGEVTAVNPAVAANPALVNTAPYGDGWLFKLKLTAPGPAAALLDAAGYQAQIAAGSAH